MVLKKQNKSFLRRATTIFSRLMLVYVLLIMVLMPVAQAIMFAPAFSAKIAQDDTGGLEVELGLFGKITKIRFESPKPDLVEQHAELYTNVLAEGGTHDSTATVTPHDVAASTNYAFDVEVCNDPGSDDPIDEFRIYEYGDFSDFDCKEKTGWELNWIEAKRACHYTAENSGEHILPGNCVTFEFNATTPDTECCRAFEFETRDTDFVWKLIYDDICVDPVPPETDKSFQPKGTFKIGRNGVEWIDGVTEVVLDGRDDVGQHDNGIVETWYKNVLARNLKLNNSEEPCWDVSFCQGLVDGYDAPVGEFVPYEGPFQKEGESCHVLWYYSVDGVGNVEDMKVNCFFVDTTPPKMDMTIGDPIVECRNGEECSEFNYWVRDWYTNITMNCTDMEPHPSGDEEACYRVIYDFPSWPTDITEQYYCDNGYMDNGWCCADAPETIQFKEDSRHDLEYFCRDAVNKTSEIDLEKFRVDSLPPIINKTMFGNYLGECPPYMPWEECYVADNGGSGVHIEVKDNETYDCAIDDISCEYEIWWQVPKGLLVLCQETDDGWCLVETGDFSESIDIYFKEDSTHNLTIRCEDALGNSVDDLETFLVDSTPPNTTKTYIGPFHHDQETHPEDAEYIDGVTRINLTAEDEKVGVNETYYRVTLVDESNCVDLFRCENATGNGTFNIYTGLFGIGEESCHLIEYYSDDLLGNVEPIKQQCVFVDLTSPVLNKTVGEPALECGEGDVGVSYCDGIPANNSCGAYSEEQCSGLDQDGCTWNEYISCDGIPRNDSCNNYETEDQCGLVSGCNWTTPTWDDCAGWPEGDACRVYSQDQCGIIPGCEWGRIDNYCYGTPEISCYDIQDIGEQHNYTDKCLETAGCYWENYEGRSFCEGTPDSCAVIPEPFLCDGEPMGCEWVDESWCSGNLTSCSALDDDMYKCEVETPGCDWIYEPGDDCDYWVRDHVTPITLNCTDVGQHPSGNEEVCYRVNFDFEEPDNRSAWHHITEQYCNESLEVIDQAGYEGEWCCVPPAATIVFENDSLHELDYFCRDAVDKKTGVELTAFRVDSVAPNTTKEYIEPYYYDVNVEWIDSASFISLTATDGGEICAVGGEQIYYKVTRLTGKDEIACSDPVNHCNVTRTHKSKRWQKYYEPFPIQRESCHKIEFYSEDVLGNTEPIQVQCVFVDKSPPRTRKMYQGPVFPRHHPPRPGHFPRWISTNTSIHLNGTDPEPHPSGVNETRYRVTLVEDGFCDWNRTDTPCRNATGVGDWMVYNESFTIDEESCHLIEYYSVDNVNKTERERRQCVYVDDTPPVTNKTVGEPRAKWDGTDSIFYPNETAHCWDETGEEIECWKVTMTTPIELGCIDQGVHPVNKSRVCFNVELDGDDYTQEYCRGPFKFYNKSGDGFCCVRPHPHSEDRSYQFLFREETEHNLKYYCEDMVGNKGEIDEEKFKVTGTSFEIPLFKKWNLISVPFVLLDDDPEVVFETVADSVEAVWTYDPEHVICGDDWCVWTPGDAPDDLRIQPGWGYWVLSMNGTTEDPVWLIIGGSLFHQGPVAPPSRSLQAGWNLIGYYGTSWELYPMSDANFVCGDAFSFPDRFIYGDKAYCSLNSLIDTQEGYPRWSSLWSFINCGDHQAIWLGINTCADQDSPMQMALSRMYAGRGYWVELDIPEMYAPSTSCIWNDDFECRWTGGGIIP